MDNTDNRGRGMRSPGEAKKTECQPLSKHTLHLTREAKTDKDGGKDEKKDDNTRTDICSET